MSFVDGQYLKVSDFNLLKAKVKAEMLRRCYTGDVSSYGSSAYDYSKPAKQGLPVTVEYANKIIVPVKQVNDTAKISGRSVNFTDVKGIQSNSGNPVPFDPEQLHDMETLITSYSKCNVAVTTLQETGCKGSCTGLCYTGCASGCNTTCLDGCSHSCLGGCSSSCSGGCSGCGGCGSGCSGCGGCGGACSSNCSGGNCGGYCTGTCNGTCGHCGACGATCAGTATSCYNCAGTCKGGVS